MDWGTHKKNRQFDDTLLTVEKYGLPHYFRSPGLHRATLPISSGYKAFMSARCLPGLEPGFGPGLEPGPPRAFNALFILKTQVEKARFHCRILRDFG
jgi:hypothetical protein